MAGPPKREPPSLFSVQPTLIERWQSCEAWAGVECLMMELVDNEARESGLSRLVRGCTSV